ncbi:MATE family efflux transporter [Phenylobacterium immobile]|uniref:MATE family efflux transporter n=1 Tax=Phenylobacterium immobile TaxID=21 RepID=UPI000AEF23E7|nr:MATE family efflux transporter [Phenylobacterium immobile]
MRAAALTELNALVRLAWPVIVARLGIMAMGLTDAVVVGRYSARELGYHALGWAATSVVVTAVIGLLVGAQVMAARALGRGDRRETGAVLRRAVVYAVLIGVASALALAATGPIFLRNIGLESDLADGAARVLVVFCLSLPAYALSAAGSMWLEGLGRPGPAAALMWVANLVNLALVVVLVPGGFGLPALGAVGGAWGTFGARIFLVMATFLYIIRMAEARDLGVFDKAPRDRPAEVEQRRIGFGAGASNTFEVAAFAGMNVFAGWIGGLAVAAYAIVLNVSAIVFMIPLGLATAAAVRVGRAYGAGDRRGVTRSGVVAFAVAAAGGLLAAAVIAPIAGPIVRGYTRDALTISLAVPALLLACLMFVPDSLQVVIAQALRARGDVLAPTVTHLASYIFLMLPLAWALAIPAGLGVIGIVWGIVIASTVSAVLLGLRFWRLSRRPV